MVLTCFSLLMPAFSLPYAPTALPNCLRRLRNAPLPVYPEGYQYILADVIPSFGAVLEPRYIIRATAFD